MTALLLHGAGERSAALRHEVRLAIGDPFALDDLTDSGCETLTHYDLTPHA